MRAEKAMDIFSLKLHAEESQKIEVVLSSILKNFKVKNIRILIYFINSVNPFFAF